MAKLNERDWQDVRRALDMLPVELQFEGTLTQEQQEMVDDEYPAILGLLGGLITRLGHHFNKI